MKRLYEVQRQLWETIQKLVFGFIKKKALAKGEIISFNIYQFSRVSYANYNYVVN